MEELFCGGMECIVTSIRIGKIISFIKTSVVVNAVNHSNALEKHGRQMSKGDFVNYVKR